MRIGVTGHQRLTDASAWEWVEEVLLRVLGTAPDLEAVTSLAIGADQLFARCALAVGGRLVAVIPFEGIARSFTVEGDRLEFERLRSAAASAIVMPDQSDDESAYLEAGRKVVELSDMVVAVWDGKPAKGKGGTADAVALAIALGRPVLHLEPYSRTETRISNEP